MGTGWYRIYADGSEIPVSVPGKCEADRGEKVVITTILPEAIEEDAYTKGHSIRVAEYSKMIACKAGKDVNYNLREKE